MTPARSYIICATPRSGTTLLCDLLADTGIAGRPDSFFRRQSIDWWTDRLGVSSTAWRADYDFDAHYLAAVLREGEAGTGVFGMRLMWEHLFDLTRRLGALYPGMDSDLARLAAVFGPLRFIHLSREDKIAQAVSRLRAEQSGLWHLNADGSERERQKPERAAVYDVAALAKQVSSYAHDDGAWVNWFREQNIEPVRITYEALADHPRETLAIVLQALGLDPERAAETEPRTARLADRESLAWAARFRQEKINHER